MILVYIPKITNRLRFCFNFIFRDVLGVETKLCTDTNEFAGWAGAKFSYAQHPTGDELFFQSRNILFETGITDQNITVFDHKGGKVFFATGKNSALPFDPFAATFYMLSRYEEYLPHIRDMYDRFDVIESLAYRNNFLHMPVVDQWALLIADLIKARFPDENFPERNYKYISTIDIDNAYAYREKGFVRTLGGYARALKEFDLTDLKERTKVFAGTMQDPYDTYTLQLDIQKKYRLKCIYFFLLGDYGVNDKNVPVQSRKFQSLIKSLGDHADIGIHPSFASNKDHQRLKTEIGRLSHIVNAEITKSRQHFLILNFPYTYRNLIEADITDDYTMGFAGHVGFRAGTCTPFNFYDLDMEVETKLRLHPFAVMEATLKYYMKVDPQDVPAVIKPIVDEIKKVNGTFYSLWHNESMSNNRHWNGWKDVYEEMVKIAVA
ncbi:MAG TPA: polysaccharide deacetylase family protein [Bacteroidia bacterium]|jgi:hypothetical protein